MRVLVWKDTPENVRAQIMGRGVGAIFSPELKTTIAKILAR